MLNRGVLVVVTSSSCSQVCPLQRAERCLTVASSSWLPALLAHRCAHCNVRSDARPWRPRRGFQLFLLTGVPTARCGTMLNRGVLVVVTSSSCSSGVPTATCGATLDRGVLVVVTSSSCSQVCPQQGAERCLTGASSSWLPALLAHRCAHSKVRNDA